ncbi:hypothetical protein AAFF_G00083190 [Aldrovandia affinis]|uniref:THAP domain-containing protein 1 n=1 Tax=Aldrovandia affinis TaxID=143900 RepID=A0AAD7WDJ5_9TELE|nr:hypothetical protein AAFF_G00083190 [Aldrovandia affinis]
MSFHDFPTNSEQRKDWVQAVKRDEGADFKIRRGSTFVCSHHFNSDDYQPSTTTGSKRLKAGMVPSRFKWNSYGEKPRRESAFERVNVGLGVNTHETDSPQQQDTNSSRKAMDHDYTARPPGEPSNDPLSPDYIPSKLPHRPETSKKIGTYQRSFRRVSTAQPEEV